jgi:hypothetical protein
MSRGAHTFKQTDVTKAVKGVVKAGVKAGRVDIVPGKISVFFGETEAPAPQSNDANE